MKPKTLVLLAVAGGCGLIAMFCVQQAMQSSQGEVVQVETRKVLVALENIEVGSTIDPEKVTFRELPVTSLPPETELITTIEQYDQRGARVPLFANDLITVSKLTEPGGTGNSMKIPKGMRVITIPVNETDSASNLLSPGDRVDVLVTFQARNGRASTTKMKTLLEYVEVFATNAKTSDKVQNEDKAGRTSHISLLLKPEQVNYVKLADSKGTLSLSWRHKLDDEFVQTRDMDEELLEELQGSIGINEMTPLYDDTFAVGSTGTGYDSFQITKPEDEAATPAEFLDQAEREIAPPPAPAAPKEPQWVMHIYNGNQARPYEFALASGKPTGTPNAQAAVGSAGQDGNAEAISESEAATNPLADKMRDLFNGKN